MGSIDATRSGSVVTLTLRHEGRANALDFAMLAQLERHLADVEGDAGVRALLLRGSAGGAFCSGADVREWAPLTPRQFARDWVGYGNRIFDRLERLRCPTLAAVEGLCFGGGLELALCADLRVGTAAARFRFPEVGIGAIPGWRGGTRLARIAGRGRALEAVLTMRTLDAETAVAWGLLNAAWAPEQFERQLADYLERVTQVSPRAAALAKAVLLAETDLEQCYGRAAEEIKASADADIGVRAFFGKSRPQF